MLLASLCYRFFTLILVASVFLTVFFYPVQSHAVELNSVPKNIKLFLQSFDYGNSSLELQYGDDGSVTVFTPENSQKYIPVLPNPSIDQNNIESLPMQMNPDGSINFGRGQVADIIYVPLQQSELSYPSFPVSFVAPIGSEIPSNVVLPAGFIPPNNVSYNRSAIAPLNALSFLAQAGISGIEQQNDGSLLFNGSHYKPFFGMIQEVGKPMPGTNPNITFSDKEYVIFPDGMMYYNNVNSAYLTQDTSGAYTIASGVFPQNMPLPAGVERYSDGSIHIPRHEEDDHEEEDDNDDDHHHIEPPIDISGVIDIEPPIDIDPSDFFDY